MTSVQLPLLGVLAVVEVVLVGVFSGSRNNLAVVLVGPGAEGSAPVRTPGAELRAAALLPVRVRDHVCAMSTKRL